MFVRLCCICKAKDLVIVHILFCSLFETYFLQSLFETYFLQFLNYKCHVVLINLV